MSDGRAEMAAALRATAGRVPFHVTTGFGEWWWHDQRNWSETGVEMDASHLPGDLFDALPVECEYIDSDGQIAFKRFDTAADAIRDLCRAYIAVHIKSEVTA